MNLSAYESRVLWCIFRKTYGWNKKTDRISYTQFEMSTGIKRWHIARTLKGLLERKMVNCAGEGYALEYTIQKDYELWQSLPKQVTAIITQTGNEIITNLGNDSLPKEVTMGGEKSLPIQVASLPIQVASLPKEVTKSLPKEVTTKERKHITKAFNKSKGGPLKQKFGEFNNVLLTTDEYLKLTVKFGEHEALKKIEELSIGIESKGYKYESHYATILNWARRDKEGRPHGANQANPRQVPAAGEYETPEQYIEKRRRAGAST